MNGWKSLKRHALSADYDDLTGPKWDAFLAGFDDGFMLDHPIVMHCGEIIDGWQRQRACIQLGIEPVYLSLPDDADLVAFVAKVNDNRRHESWDSVAKRAAKRIAERRERVAKSRDESKSLRTIAEEEKVSIATVQRDLAENEVYPPDTPETTPRKTKENEETPAPTTTGADGKTYPKNKKKLLCERCARVGIVKDCVSCTEVRKAARKAAMKAKKEKPATGPEQCDDGPPEPEPIGVPCDGNGVPWSGHALIAIEVAPKFKEMSRQLSKMAKTIVDDESLRLYTFSMQSVIAGIRTIQAALLDALPSYVCPYCDGTLKTVEGPEKGKACEVCCRQGWVGKSTYRRSPKGYVNK